MALSVFEALPPDLAELAIREFADVVRSGLYNEAGVLLTGPGWRLRDVLLPRLEDLAEPNRRAFARLLYDRGFDVAVPGITFSEKDSRR
jgi:hypothetical protein